MEGNKLKGKSHDLEVSLTLNLYSRVVNPIKKPVRLRTSFFIGFTTSRGLLTPYLKWNNLINCILHVLVIGSAHRLTKRNICLKFKEITLRVQEIWSGHEIHG